MAGKPPPISLINRRELVDSIQGFKTVHLVAGGSTGPDCTGTPRRSSPLLAPPFVFCCAIIGGRSMLWTVFRNQPFEECLEKVVEAGYQGVELVGEFKKWSEEGRAKNKKTRRLGKRTAGSRQSLNESIEVSCSGRPLIPP